MPKEGAIENFIAAFNDHEQSANLFSLHDEDAFPWWDLVRYDVQMALCVEKGIYGRRQTPSPPVFSRAKSFARQSAVLARDLQRIQRIPPDKLQQMLIYKRDLQPFKDAITEMMSTRQAALLVNTDAVDAPPHLAIAKQSIDFFIRVVQRTKVMPLSLKAQVGGVARAIQENQGSKQNIFAIIEEKYRSHLAAKQAWVFILDRVEELDRIMFFNDDTLKTLVFLARQRGIATQEVQHGYMGRSHIGYSYPLLESSPTTLPDSVVITRDTGDITYPVEKVTARSSAPSSETTPRDIDVLVATSPSNRLRTIQLVAALIGKGWHVAVKLHPTQTPKSAGLLQHFSSDELTLHDGKEEFISLARRATVFVPANPMSTTSFEAVENGAKLIVIDYDGVKITSQVDGIVFSRVDTLDRLSEAVGTALAASRTSSSRSVK